MGNPAYEHTNDYPYAALTDATSRDSKPMSFKSMASRNCPTIKSQGLDAG